MKKYFALILGVCMAAAACTKEQGNVVSPQMVEEGTYPVSVTTRISGDRFETGSGFEPMGRAGEGEIVFNMDNVYWIVLMKQLEDKWVVEKSLEPKFDKTHSNPYNARNMYADDVSDPVTMELRPGNYKMLVVFNHQSAARNDSLTHPGYVVSRTADGSDVPMAIRYKINGQAGYASTGKPFISREIFTAFTEFKVEKTDSLAAMPLEKKLSLTAKRRVAKFRIMLQTVGENTVVQSGSLYHTTYKMTSKGKPFCDGVDAWNGAYFSSTPRMEKLCGQQFSTPVQTSTNGKVYLFPCACGRDYNPYHFVDPDDEEGTPFEISDFYLLFNGSAVAFRDWEAHDANIINNHITGIVYEEREDGFYQDEPLEGGGYQATMPVTVSTASDDPADIFTSFHEFNRQ